MHQNLRQSQDVVLRGKCVALTTTSEKRKRASATVQQVKVSVAKPDDLSLNPRTHLAEGEH